jgi:hypothetical protein
MWVNETSYPSVSWNMKDSPKLSGKVRTRLLVIVVLAVLTGVALAATVPGVLLGPAGGAIAGY